MQTCKTLHATVNQDKGSFWFLRFKETFDNPSWTVENTREAENERYKAQYMQRMVMLRGTKHFVGEHGTKSFTHLVMLREIMLQSFSCYRGEASSSNNIDRIRDYVQNSNLSMPFARKSNKHQDDEWYHPNESDRNNFLMTMQIMVAPLILDTTEAIEKKHISRPFSSQTTVYRRRAITPLWTDEGLRIRPLTFLYHLNFWRDHLVAQQGHLASMFAQLSTNDRPQFWSQQLTDSVQIGKHWWTCHAYLSDRDYDTLSDYSVYALELVDATLHDLFIEEYRGYLARQVLIEVVTPDDHYWPDIFDEHFDISERLQMMATVATRLRHRHESSQASEPQLLCVTGEITVADKQYKLTGWLHTLPDQHRIPGWARLSMIRYQSDTSTGVVNEHRLFAYDGVMIPGGKIIFGRCWEILDIDPDFCDTYGGPFLWWNTD